MAPLFPHRSRAVGRRLLRAWALQGVTWYGLMEIAMRGILEGSLVIALAIAGFPLLSILVAWLLFHTAAWFVLYGGFHLTWKLLGLAAGTARIEAHVDRLRTRTPRARSWQTVILRGGVARGDLDDRSDIDLLLVPKAAMLRKVAGILHLWTIRVESILRRVPVEARWIDSPKYVPYHLQGEPIVVLAETARPVPLGRLGDRGLLVTFSGIDGSGKTTVAKQVVVNLRAEGVDITRFWAHRQAWLRPSVGPDLGLAVLFESYWKRLGRGMEDLRQHGRVRSIYDALTVLDYVYVRLRLVRMLRPHTVVLCDRYVADVITYLKAWGPLRPSLEGILVGLSREPDLAILFELTPQLALERKAENPEQQLAAFAREFEALTPKLGLVSVDAGNPVDQVVAEVLRLLAVRLGLASGSQPKVQPLGADPSLVPSDRARDGA